MFGALYKFKLIIIVFCLTSAAFFLALLTVLPDTCTSYPLLVSFYILHTTHPMTCSCCVLPHEPQGYPCLLLSSLPSQLSNLIPELSSTSHLVPHMTTKTLVPAVCASSQTQTVTMPAAFFLTLPTAMLYTWSSSKLLILLCVAPQKKQKLPCLQPLPCSSLQCCLLTWPEGWQLLPWSWEGRTPGRRICP